jgi:hypothetical protein
MISPSELRLREAVSWFLVTGQDASEITLAAAHALVEGLDSPALRELAGLERGSSRAELRVASVAAFDELHLRYPDLDTEHGQLFALSVLCRRYLDGVLSHRELTSWAHANIGHGGAETAQDLVLLDDALDEIGTSWRTMAEVHADIELAATAFLANYPRE